MEKAVIDEIIEIHGKDGMLECQLVAEWGPVAGALKANSADGVFRMRTVLQKGTTRETSIADIYFTADVIKAVIVPMEEAILHKPKIELPTSFGGR